jgi:hypothetical protein
MTATQTNPSSLKLSSHIHTYVVGFIVFLFFLGSMLHTLREYHGNYSGFLRISQEMAAKNPFLKSNPKLLNQLMIVNDSGYDGALFYSMTFDPFTTKLNNTHEYENVVAAPVFRYRRILFVWITHFVSFGNPYSFPKTMVYLLLFSHFVGSVLLAKTFRFFGKSPYLGLLWILIPAFSVSLRYATPESIAAVFVVGAYYSYLKDRIVLSTVLFALASLTRETPLLFLTILAAVEFRKRQPKIGLLLLSSALPYLLWRIWVTYKFVPVYGWSGFFFEPPNLTLPFIGIAQLYQTIMSSAYIKHLVPAGIIFPLLLGSLFLIGILSLRNRNPAVTISLIAYSALSLCLSYQKIWIHVGNAERQTYEVFLLAILLFVQMKPEQRLLRKIVLAFFCVLFLFDFLLMSEDVSFRAGFWILPASLK